MITYIIETALIIFLLYTAFIIFLAFFGETIKSCYGVNPFDKYFKPVETIIIKPFTPKIIPKIIHNRTDIDYCFCGNEIPTNHYSHKCATCSD